MTETLSATTEQPLPTDHLLAPPPGKQATILLQPGSFSPITNSHLRLLICARDTLLKKGHHIAGAYITPVNDTYAKESLVAYTHRIRMCEEAIRPFEWARVDTWEACQPRFVRTHEVATRIVERVGEVLGCEVCVFVVCGDDLVGCMQNREIWPKESVQKLCEVVAFVVKKRVCGDLSHFKGHVVWIDGWVGDLSSTLVREHVRNGWSVAYMMPDRVAEYMYRHGLYLS